MAQRNLFSKRLLMWTYDSMATFNKKKRKNNLNEMPLYRSVTQTFPFECALCEHKVCGDFNCMQQRPNDIPEWPSNNSWTPAFLSFISIRSNSNEVNKISGNACYGFLFIQKKTVVARYAHFSPRWTDDTLFRCHIEMLLFVLNEFHFCVGIYQQVVSERTWHECSIRCRITPKCTQQTENETDDRVASFVT